MRYSDFEIALANPRLGKYLRACSGDKQKALRLYRANVRMSQKFYGMIGILEVTLRNAINEHYKVILADSDWIINQAKTGFLRGYKDTIIREYSILAHRGVYTNDKLLSNLTFGAWTYMFSRKCYKNAGKTLLNILPNRRQGFNQSSIYKNLNDIRSFRNRIAHHEALCFNYNGEIDTSEAKRIFDLIQECLYFLGYAPNEILYGIELPISAIEKINSLKASI